MPCCSFAQPIQTMKPEELTNAMINDIGSWYLEKYPTPTQGFFAKLFDNHTNQGLAKKLLYYKENSTCEQKWQFLANLLGQFPRIWGQLAGKILDLFENAFQTEIETSEFHTSRTGGYESPRDSLLVAEDCLRSVLDHYHPHQRFRIQLTYAAVDQ